MSMVLAWAIGGLLLISLAAGCTSDPQEEEMSTGPAESSGTTTAGIEPGREPSVVGVGYQFHFRACDVDALTGHANATRLQAVLPSGFRVSGTLGMGFLTLHSIRCDHGVVEQTSVTGNSSTITREAIESFSMAFLGIGIETPDGGIQVNGSALIHFPVLAVTDSPPVLRVLSKYLNNADDGTFTYGNGAPQFLTIVTPHTTMSLDAHPTGVTSRVPRTDILVDRIGDNLTTGISFRPGSLPTWPGLVAPEVASLKLEGTPVQDALIVPERLVGYLEHGVDEEVSMTWWPPEIMASSE